MSARAVRLLVVLPVAAVLVVFGGLLVMRSLGPGMAQTPTNPTRDEFASDRAPKQAEKPAVAFDGKRAMKYLTQLCEIGPRVSGSEGMRKQRELVVKHFEEHGATVRLQEFPAKQRSRPKETVAMANVIAAWHPERKTRVILCAHYDTRPIADQEPQRRRWSEPFVSANDGTSGVAWLMELAHHMKDLPTAVGVDFVLFDGEEYVFEPGTGLGDGDRYFLGSDHFAAEYQKQRPAERPKYTGAVLLDLFAGHGATYLVERNSLWQAGRLVDTIWDIAREQGCDAFVPRPGYEVSDDHLALNRAGIPAVDIIDMSYKHWHRLSDTPEQCSPERMGQVATVLIVWLQRQK
jgi:hypothetical protein